MTLHRFAHQVTAFGLAAVFTLSILGSIDMLASQPVDRGVMAAEQAASQVARSQQGNALQRAGG